MIILLSDFREVLKGIGQLKSVGVPNEKIVGYLAGTLYSQYSYNNIVQAELDNMCIMNEYRKLGIGSKLFEEFNVRMQTNIHKYLNMYLHF